MTNAPTFEDFPLARLATPDWATPEPRVAAPYVAESDGELWRELMKIDLSLDASGLIAHKVRLISWDATEHVPELRAALQRYEQDFHEVMREVYSDTASLGPKARRAAHTRALQMLPSQLAAIAGLLPAIRPLEDLTELATLASARVPGCQELLKTIEELDLDYSLINEEPDAYSKLQLLNCYCDVLASARIPSQVDAALDGSLFAAAKKLSEAVLAARSWMEGGRPGIEIAGLLAVWIQENCLQIEDTR